MPPKSGRPLLHPFAEARSGSFSSHAGTPVRSSSSSSLVGGAPELRAAAGSPLAVARLKRSEGIEAVKGIAWSKSVSLPQAYRAQGTSIALTEQRGITLPQLGTLADLVQRVLGRVELFDSFAGNAPITWDAVNLYHMNDHFVMPMTQQFRCSFVELVAEGPQLPMWFVSHWWGTPFHQTHALLNFHAQQRQLPADAPYWICTFANNQHNLSELSGGLEATPFVRAILSEQCEGTIALLDKDVTTFERIWCVLELHVSTEQARASKPRHLFDLAAWLAHGTATYGGNPVPAKPTLRMDLGDGRMDESVQDEGTGGAFPLIVSAKGAKIDIVKAKASRPEDRRNILHLIADTPEDAREAEEPPASCDGYNAVSTHARGMFASGAMYRAAVQGDVAELGRLLTDFPQLKDEGISDGATALYAAAWKGNAEALDMLLAARADANRPKADGATPLFVAAQVGNKEAIEALLSARADPALSRVADGVSPVFMATQKRHIPELELLLAAGADANAATAKGASALHLAVQEGQSKVVKALLVGRADPNIATPQGSTPAMLVPHRQRTKILQLLKEANAGGAKAARAGGGQQHAEDSTSDGEAPTGSARRTPVEEPARSGSARSTGPEPAVQPRPPQLRPVPAPRGPGGQAAGRGRGSALHGQARSTPVASPRRATGPAGPLAPLAGGGRGHGDFQRAIVATNNLMGALDYSALEGLDFNPPRPPAAPRRRLGSR